MSKKLISFTLAALFVATSLVCADDKKVTRAAFDLGSGTFKVVVAEVNGEDVNVKFSKMISVGLGNDLAESKDQTLSSRVQDAAFKALQELKKDAEKQKATEFQGVATEVFRKAKNGEALLTKLTNVANVNLQVISQEKEGMIGFNTAAVLTPEENKTNLISWDSGGASFQIVGTDGQDHYNIYKGALGSAVVLKILMEEVRKQPYTQEAPINPLSAQECDALVKALQNKISAPKWLKNRMKNQDASIVGIGDSNSMFAHISKRVGSDHFTIEDVRQAIQDLAGKTDDDFKQEYNVSRPKAYLTEIVLLYAVMDKFGIHEVTFKEANGSTIGLLIDKEFWKSVVPQTKN
ncbi:MAG TPA: hypothetical protein VLG76_05355 [Rhabdochlamydiaceae bacterium]|nr:hypothetical protein [Rhabdochlamydiaceae bacterium]